MTVSAEKIQAVKDDGRQNAAVSRASFIIKRLKYITTADLAKWQEVAAAIEALDASELKAIISNFEEWLDER